MRLFFVDDVINLLSPELVVLGGHVFGHASQIVRTVEVTIRKRALETATRTSKIEFTSFGDDALALGGAAAVYDCLIDQDNVFGATNLFRERFPIRETNQRGRCGQQ